MNFFFLITFQFLISECRDVVIFFKNSTQHWNQTIKKYIYSTAAHPHMFSVLSSSELSSRKFPTSSRTFREMIYFAQKWKTLYSLFVGVLQFPTLCFRFFIGLRLLCHIYYYRRIFKKKYLKLSFLITFSFLIKEFGDVVIFFIRPSMNFFYSL